MNDDTCFIQTVSGGVGPAGVMEAAYQLEKNPKFLLIQPKNGNSTPIVDALEEHSRGNNPLSLIQDSNYETSSIEPTLGSTKPVYAIQKFIDWRENGGRISGAKVNQDDLVKYKEKILNLLIEAKVYPNKKVGLELFDLEKSGFIAFAGAIKSIKDIETKTVVINFTGRYPENGSNEYVKATPHKVLDLNEGIKYLLTQLNY